MTILAALLGFSAVVCWADGGSRVPRYTRPRDPRGSTAPVAERRWVRVAACVLGAATIGSLVGGALLAGVGGGIGAAIAWWLGTLEPAAVLREREQVARDLPMAAELLAACAQVGAPMDRALSLVADALGGPLAARLRGVVTRLDLGADPAGEWRRLEGDPALATLARTMVRALESGAPPADGLSRLASDRRRDRRSVLLGRARAVGVRTAGPLVACFLPAFMLVGVVPIVVGVFSQLALWPPGRSHDPQRVSLMDSVNRCGFPLLQRTSDSRRWSLHQRPAHRLTTRPSERTIMNRLLPSALASAPARQRDERGMNTAEYAVGTGAACGFGGLLFSILTSDFGKNLIEGILDKVTGLLPF